MSKILDMIAWIVTSLVIIAILALFVKIIYDAGIYGFLITSSVSIVVFSLIRVAMIVTDWSFERRYK